MPGSHARASLFLQLPGSAPSAFSIASTNRSPSRCWIRFAPSRSTRLTIMVTVSAPAHSSIRTGYWLTSSITVAIELDPAIAGTARGMLNGSPANIDAPPHCP